MTYGEAVRVAARALEQAGIEDGLTDARALMAEASGLDRAELAMKQGDEADADLLARFEQFIAQRLKRQPVSQILGTVGFWTLDLTVTADVLTPRPDSETIIEVALEPITDRNAALRVLDIATGSGALGLAMLSELPQASGVATDISAPALEVARSNAARAGLADRIRFVETSWSDGLTGPFDLIVSNPPYIASGVIETLDPEVKDHEPRLALDGGVDGLAFYPHLMAEARRLLKPGGAAVFEIGFDQAEAARALATAAEAHEISVRQDLAGRDRALSIRFD